MNSEDIRQIIKRGESTKIQFKVRVEESYKIATEMVAFSNSYGGLLIIGVDDKTGEISGLSYDEIQATNTLLANAASENVKPAIVLSTKQISIDSQTVIVASITEGKDKPYKDNKGIIWVKNGSDKRKIFSNNELRVMMQRCGNLSADSDSVENTSYRDISESTLKNFLFERYDEECKKAGITNDTVLDRETDEIVKAIDPNFTAGKLLQNLQLMNSNGQLTLSGLLLLSKNIQRYCPVFTIKCVSFVGNSIAGTQFRDKMRDRDAEGNLLTQYSAAISFVTRNLRSIQTEKEFNTIGQLEIPLEVFVELLTNAFIHRDYYVNSPIRLFIFDNRIEIHSPGVLPDGVTEENIKTGISVPRNKLLFEYAKDILPYTGIGSGIMRAMQNYDRISFSNDILREEFIITIAREEVPEDNLIKDGVKDGVNVIQQAILDTIQETPKITAKSLSEKLKINIRNIEKNIKILKDRSYIKRIGSDRTGYWEIIKK
jgi:predicted HTH transcriptional regulator